MIGFSLPYEQLYTNVLTMLDLADIPFRAADRTTDIHWLSLVAPAVTTPNQ